MSRPPASRRRLDGLSPFPADMARFDAAFRAAGAVRTGPDGFAWIDAEKAPPAMLQAFRLLTEYGYANGLL